LRIAEQIWSGDVVMMPDLGAAHAAEQVLGPIGASAVQAVRLLMINALHFEAAVEIVPGTRLIGVHNGSLGGTRLDE
jgi:hypothetical protein